MKKFSLVIGNFDGVHRGHRHLLERSVSSFGYEPWVMTFEPHPMSFLRPKEAPVRILDRAQKERELHRAGVKEIRTLRFDQDLVELSGPEFFERHIKSIGPQHLSVGLDFRFGRGRGAGVADLEKFCHAQGISFQCVEPLKENGVVVSSSLIRQLLAQRNFISANGLLGRDFSMAGTVVHGRQLGRTIGFPTANLQLPTERMGRLPLPNGVYAGRHSEFGPFIMNVGWAPTVNQGKDLKVEVHFLGGAPELYGRALEVAPTEYLRDEKKFSSVDELKSQLVMDRQQAMEKMETSF